jgi:uncharacterized protein YndB with AHSA1/START domain
MSDRSAAHATFVIERSYPASPARVFAAFADPDVKAQWFVGPEEFVAGGWSLDFRVGGKEVNRGGPPEGPVYTYEATYRDIVPDERIVTTYEMYMDDARISVSVATFEFVAEGAGTRLVLTEQGVFLDGLDTAAQREEGTGVLLDALGTALEKAAA